MHSFPFFCPVSDVFELCTFRQFFLFSVKLSTVRTNARLNFEYTVD